MLGVFPQELLHLGQDFCKFVRVAVEVHGGVGHEHPVVRLVVPKGSVHCGGVGDKAGKVGVELRAY